MSNEKPATSSKDLTSPEYATQEKKDSSKNIKVFPQAGFVYAWQPAIVRMGACHVPKTRFILTQCVIM